MVVRAGLGERLRDVPVLDDLVVVESEDVDDDRASVPGDDGEEAVGDDDVVLGDDPADVEVELRCLRDERRDELDEPFLAVGRVGGCAGCTATPGTVRRRRQGPWR